MLALNPQMPPLRALLLCASPGMFVIAAAGSALAGASVPLIWRTARWCATLAVLAALLSLAWLLACGAALDRGPALLTFAAATALRPSLNSDALGCLMLLLVSFIGWVIVGYSTRCLAGEHGQRRYVRNLMLTLAAVSLLVTTNNVLMLALAWIVTSLSLHGLLTFFDTRAQALIAAHKKFLVSRIADLCLLAGVALIGNALGTLEIDQAIAAARALPAISLQMHAAALLVAASALLKCAQLPVHGWLIQVMEAPTPVSALLHAGVVNLGGFLLIRLGSLVGDVPAAQALLVVVGSASAVLAALVMMTRISIKVSLAWSTCAQMGFMLMQCGLGLYDLALLHLLTHSLYKAHAFLGAGGAVEQNRLRQMTPPPSALPFGAWMLAALMGTVLVGVAAMAWGFSPARAPALWAVGFILSLALAPLIAGRPRRSGWWALAGPSAAFAVALAYFGLHRLLAHVLGGGGASTPPGPVLVSWVIGCFGLLFVVQGNVRARPKGILARRLYPWMFAGLYLDELFTRLTFRVWPARVQATTGELAAGRPALANVNYPGAL